MKPTPKHMKTFTKIEPGAPVLTPDNWLGVARLRTAQGLWEIDTQIGEQRFLSRDLELLQPHDNLTLARVGAEGAPVATHRGYGVVRSFSISPAGLCWWSVELIIQDGEIFDAVREDITVLVPGEDHQEPEKKSRTGAAKLAEAQILRAMNYAHRRGVAALCAGCQRPFTGPEDLELRMKGHVDEDKEKAATGSARVYKGPMGIGKTLGAADALRMRQTKEAPRAFAQDENSLPTLSNAELSVALEDAVKLSGRHSLSEGLRPLIEQHAARLMTEQWRRASPAVVKTWNDELYEDPMEESDD